jgi:hypothetical protein
VKPFVTRDRWQKLVWARPRSITIFGIHQLLSAVLLVLSMASGSSFAGLLLMVVTFPFFVAWPVLDAQLASYSPVYSIMCIVAWLVSGVFWTFVVLGFQRMWRSSDQS